MWCIDLIGTWCEKLSCIRFPKSNPYRQVRSPSLQQPCCDMKFRNGIFDHSIPLSGRKRQWVHPRQNGKFHYFLPALNNVTVQLLKMVTFMFCRIKWVLISLNTIEYVGRHLTSLCIFFKYLEWKYKYLFQHVKKDTQILRVCGTCSVTSFRLVMK